MLARSAIHTAHSRKSTLELLQQFSVEIARTEVPQPRFRRHWTAPKNSKGGFLCFEDSEREIAARKAAYYGPPQGPCANFRDNNFHHIPTCFCGWDRAAHSRFSRGN